jgi:hypothetical protein
MEEVSLVYPIINLNEKEKLMKRFFFLLVLSFGLIYANDVTLLKIDKKNDVWRAEVVISPPVIVDRVIVNSEGNSSEADFKTDLPTAVFFLIDTSIPMKRAYKKGIVPLLLDMGRVREPKERWTIAYFDTDMHIVFDDGDSSPEELGNVLKSIPVKGKRTELWRNAQSAVRKLSEMPEERKILVLLSDGDAEDTSAYTREDLIKMANAEHIRIASIAYRDTIGSQNLRKIAEETHGIFWKADRSSHKLPIDFHRDMVKFIRSQGIVTIPSTLLHATRSGSQELEILFEHAGESSSVKLTVETEKRTPPAPKPKPKVKPAAPVKPVQAKPSKPDKAHPSQKAHPPKVDKSDFQIFLEKYKLYLAIVGVLLLFLVLYLIFARKKDDMAFEEEREKEGDGKTVSVEMPGMNQKEEATIIAPSQPIAYFEAFDGAQHAVFQLPADIGKSATNDVVIDRQYVSRKHAVLTHRDGYFFIADNNSSNGVIINGKRIQVPTRLEDGSRVGFGPYETVFRIVTDGKTVERSGMERDDSEKTRFNVR